MFQFPYKVCFSHPPRSPFATTLHCMPYLEIDIGQSEAFVRVQRIALTQTSRIQPFTLPEFNVMFSTLRYCHKILLMNSGKQGHMAYMVIALWLRVSD